jgi:FeS assembly SUF system protein
MNSADNSPLECAILTLEERIIEALKGVYDPEIPVNIYDLGLIYSLAVNEEAGDIQIEMTLTSPGCPVAQTFPQTVQESVLKVKGVSNVVVELIWDPPWTMERMSEVAKLQLNLF